MTRTFAEGNRCKVGQNMAYVPSQDDKGDDTPRQSQHSFSFVESLCAVKTAVDTANELNQMIDAIKLFIAYNPQHKDDLGENLISRIEDFVFYVMSLSGSSGMNQILLQTMRYFKTFCTGSVCNKILGLLRHHVDDVNPHSGGMDDEDENVTVASVMKNWRKYQSHPLAKLLAEIVGLLTIFTGAPDPENVLAKDMFDIIGAKISSTRMKATSFLDAIAHIVGYIDDRVIPAIKSGDYKMLFYSDKDLQTLEERYADIMSMKAYVSTGRLDLITTENGTFANDAVLSASITQLVREFQKVARSTKSEYVRSTIARYMVNLQTFYSTLELERANNPLKKQPFAIKIFGGSATGKSHLTNVLVRHAAKAMDIDFTPETVYYQSSTEKTYDSGVKASKKVCISDDMCNANPQFTTESPLDRVLRMINMIPAYAIKAGVDDKATTPYRIELVAVNTNVRNMHAEHYSIEAGSILRRFNLHLDVRIRPQWRDQNGLPVKGAFDEMYPECYEIDIYTIAIKPRVKPCKSNEAHKPASFEYVPLKIEATIQETVRIVERLAREWNKDQINAVNRSNKIYTAPMCEHGLIQDGCQECRDNAEFDEIYHNEDESGAFIDTPKADPLVPHAGEFNVDPDFFNDPSECIHFEADEDDFEVIPMSLTESVKRFYLDHKAISLPLTMVIGVLAILKLSSCFRDATQHNDSHDHIEIELQAEKKAEYMDPSTLVQKENVWKKVQIAPLPKSPASCTTKLSDLSNYVQKNVAIFEYVPRDGNIKKPSYTMAVPYKENLWLVPYHAVSSAPQLRVTIRYGGIHDVGLKRASTTINENCWVRVEGKTRQYDLALVRIVGAGDVPNMEKFFVVNEESDSERNPGGFLPVGSRALAVLKKFDGATSQHIIPIEQPCHVQIKDRPDLSGLKIPYGKLPEGFKTYKGMCMMPLITLSSKPGIFGFHIGGNSSGDTGVAEFLDSAAVTKAYVDLNLKNDLRIASTGNFPESRMNTEIEIKPEVHPKHCTNFMPLDPHSEEYTPHSMEIFGTHNFGTATFRSRVETSPICHKVEEVFERPRDTGPPAKAPAWRDFQRDMDIIARTDCALDMDILDVAYETIKEYFIDLVGKHDTSYVKPMSLEHAINGVDGVKGFEKVDRTTSPGKPLSGAKNLIMKPAEKPVEGVSEPWEFTIDSGFYEDYKQLWSDYLKGMRHYLMFSCTLKDEPTKFSKAKRRIFASCPVVGTVASRQEFLPVIKFLQDNWKDTMCAVGINAQGAEWQELYEELAKNPLDRIVAGDYASFDKGAHTEFTLRAAYIQYAIAEACGYPEEHLAVMRGIITDCTVPLYDWYGVFVSFLGSNPSGIPMTVHMNNFVNLLYVMYSFIAMAKKEGDTKETLRARAKEFWEVIVIFLYGDDNIMSVSEKETLFNHTSLQEELKKIGVMYTMADKTSESVPFINIEDADFLKRRFHRHDNGYVTAPLAVESMFKSLYSNMAPKKSEQLAESSSAQAMYSSVLEAFQHGRDFFNEWREKMDQVADCECPNLPGVCIRELLPGGYLPTWQQCVDRYELTLEKPKRDQPFDHEGAFEPHSGTVPDPVLDEDSVRRIIVLLVEARTVDYRHAMAQNRQGLLNNVGNQMHFAVAGDDLLEARRLLTEALNLRDEFVPLDWYDMFLAEDNNTPYGG